MKKNTFVILLNIFVIHVQSQTINPQNYLLTSNSDLYGISVFSTLDPYLSPLNYSGLGLRFNHNERRYFNPENKNISMNGRISVLGGLATNPQATSSMIYVGGKYDWGVHYHLKVIENLQVLVGITADINLGVKSVMRNVNNPINVDLATNLNLSTLIRYDFILFNQKFRANCLFETPILGGMFVPIFGASYYEMFVVGNLSNAIHFSSLHNKRGLSQDINLEIPLKNSTLKFGIYASNLKYKANKDVFKQNEICLHLGYTYDIHKFKGRNNTPPANFLSTQK